MIKQFFVHIVGDDGSMDSMAEQFQGSFWVRAQPMRDDVTL